MTDRKMPCGLCRKDKPKTDNNGSWFVRGCGGEGNVWYCEDCAPNPNAADNDKHKPNILE